MVIDYTISIGNLIQIAVICIGGVSVMFAMRYDIRALKKDDLALREELKGIQAEIKQIGTVLITQADQNRRILHLEDDVRDMRHGRGFIQERSAGGIDGEYPR